MQLLSEKKNGKKKKLEVGTVISFNFFFFFLALLFVYLWFSLSKQEIQGEKAGGRRGEEEEAREYRT